MVQIEFEIANPGPIQLFVQLTYSNFSALDEMSETWPEYRKELLVYDNSLIVCPGCPSLPLLPLPEHLVQDMPRCDYTKLLKPVFLPVDPAAFSEYPYSEYGLHIPGCRVYPVHGKFNVTDTCLSGHEPFTLRMWGDSQTRSVWAGMTARLSGEAISLEQIEEGSWNFGDITGDYISAKRAWLNRLLELDDARFGSPDVIWISVGQWPAAGRISGGHWSTLQYLAYVQWVITALKDRLHFLEQSGQKIPKVIWGGLNVLPLEKILDVVRDMSDWRTIDRMAYWSRLASNLMRTAGFLCVPAFDATLPFYFDSLDGAHFHSTGANDAIMDMLWDAMSVCHPS
ncbi:hypothetical protein HDU86_007772 [Geranomyces michiganensis]|nr:hypothetical protein HDU86_007772 [Geranomyces michiganensis]